MTASGLVRNLVVQVTETWLFKRQPHKMFKHFLTIRRQIADDCLSAFDQFVGSALKGLVALLIVCTTFSPRKPACRS